MTQLIPFDLLKVGTRQRQEPPSEDHITGLAESIASKGLMHPLVITKDRLLVAGECRSKAIQQLSAAGRTFTCGGVTIQPGMYPCIYIQDLSNTQLQEAELEENILREPLHWKDRTRAEATLHKIRTDERGAYHKSENPEGQTILKTAQEVSGTETKAQVSSVSDSIILDRHLDDPDVAAAKTKADALKIVKSKMQAEMNAMLAERQAKRPSVHVALCQEFWTDTEVKDVDLILTDPPYGIDADKFGSQTSVASEHTYKDDEGYWEALMENLADCMQECCRSRAHAYIFTAFSNYHRLVEILEARTGPSWKIWHRPLIWDKGNIGLLPDPDHGPRFVHDYILYAIRGNKPIQTTGAPDVLRFPPVPTPRRGAEKPVDLYAELLRRTATPGSLVWDPFCGTGPIFPAANRTRCRAIGHDIDPKAIDIARTRFEEDKP